MQIPPGYASLRKALNSALEQSACFKGKERHANDLPFNRQQIMQITRHVGIGFPLGQASKKINESVGMMTRKQQAAAREEILGAIVYLGAAIIFLEEQLKDKENK